MISKEIADLVDSLKTEAGMPTCYPVRYLLIKGLSAWQRTLKALRKEVDYTLNLSSFCYGDDIYPSFKRLKKWLETSNYEKVLVLPVSECICYYKADPFLAPVILSN
ncbi:MAG: hypothetical protein QHH75_14920 [Bacillota bacterium]|nr:hypothetical protein [Bacillota bacterium]